MRFYYRYDAGRTTFSVVQTGDDAADIHPRPGQPGMWTQTTPRKRTLRKEDMQPNQSVLAQRRGPEQYPEITFVAGAFSRIRIFQDWQFDRNSKVRLPQAADLPNDYLLESVCSRTTA